MKIETVVDETKTAYYPGYVRYSVDVFIPKQEKQTISIKREIIHNSFSFEGKVPELLQHIIISSIKEYVAKIYVQSDY